jgi:hypothetical protein
VSPQNSTNKPGGPYRRARPDLYTVLLVIALLAIIVAIIFLYLHMQSYNFQWKGGPPVGMIGAVPGLSVFAAARHDSRAK